jgi:hypothetical protein
MKIAESWLREWVNPDLETDELGHQLTMLGHEVDGIEYEGAGIADVVIAEVIECGKHPDADKLSVCKHRLWCTERSTGNENAFGEAGRETSKRYEAPQGEDSGCGVEWHAVLGHRTRAWR